MKRLILFAAILMSIYTCYGQDNQDEKYCKECLGRDSSTSLVFMFTGFNYSQVRNTLVKDLHNGVVVDSFYIFSDGHYDSLRFRYEGDFAFREMKLKDTYQFCIPGNSIYTMSNLKMLCKGVYHGHLCIIGQYDLNGVTCTNSNPDFISDDLKQVMLSKDSLNSPTFIFGGFTYAEVKNAVVKELENGILVDSFPLYPHERGDSVRLIYNFRGGRNRIFRSTDTYQVCLKGEAPYTLSKLKKKLIYHDNMLSGSILEQYDLDGMTYKDNYPKFMKHAVKQQCLQADSIESPNFRFEGFTKEEVCSLVVKDFHNDVLVDSFFTYPNANGDSLTVKFGGEGIKLSRYLKIKDTYQFCIPGYPSYTLSDMTSNTNIYAHCFCEIGQYKLNGEIRKGAYIPFRKNAVKISN